MSAKTSFRCWPSFLVLIIVMVAPPLAAQRLVPFQGRVADAAGQPLEGVFRITFSIYDTDRSQGIDVKEWRRK